MKPQGIGALARLLAVSCMLSSCMDTDQRIILNPDGSGKAEVTILMKRTPTDGGIDPVSEPEPDALAKDSAAGLLAGAEGVDAWSDVEWGLARKGFTEFKGVAYFPDISKVRIGAVWTMEKQADGMIALTLDPTGEPEKGGSDAPAPKRTPQEIQDAIQERRMEFQGMKGMLATFMADLKTSVVIEVPGEIQSVSFFEKTGDNVAKMSITGPQLLEGMEKAIMNDEFMQEMAEQGRLGSGMMDPPAELIEAIFGGRDAVRLTFKPGSEAFDYAVERAKAQAGMSQEIQDMMAAGENGR